MQLSPEQQRRFASAVEAASGVLRGANGIGSLGEKTLHLTLKYFYAPDPAEHERPVRGYVADVFGEQGIVEVQTAHVERLADKLAAFLPVSEVRVVCPIPVKKWLIWLDPVSGTMSERKRSPGVERVLAAVGELYGLRGLLLHPALTVEIACLEVEEYRLLDGYGTDRKKRATRYEKIPLSLRELIPLRTPADYAALLPEGLPETFTVKEFAAKAHLRGRDAGKALHVLADVGVVRRAGQSGRAFLYTLVKNE